MSNLAVLPTHEDRVPTRSPYLVDAVRLITLFVDDDELIPLVRHLYRMHNVSSVGDLDAVGWDVVNTFPDGIRPAKMKKFFRAIGRKRDGSCQPIPYDGAMVLSFRTVQP